MKGLSVLLSALLLVLAHQLALHLRAKRLAPLRASAAERTPDSLNPRLGFARHEVTL